MKHARHFFGACSVVLSAMLIAGCVSEYGDAAKYLGDVKARIAVSMPANAPSIRQEFRIGNIPGSDNGVPYSHEGIDVVAKIGTPVLAAASGRVTRSYVEPMYGNQVVIDHGIDGTGRRTQTVYKHLDKRMVSVGDTVVRGQQIGTLGRTGALAAGILHLHFEIRRQIKPGGRGLHPIDPHRLWANGEGRVTCFDPDVEIDDTVFRATYPVLCRGKGPAAVPPPEQAIGSLANLKRPEG
ncbi:M23 family metallopeptidase [Oricola indica]|uniref:M23 family metallopeptidase n=1 Tax=Oricola indica TaxID=2872591 RepID=UPI003CCB90B6